MKALVPAGGQGTRLYPQAHTTPKLMIRLAGKSILGHIIDSLIDAGITDIVLVVGSMKEHLFEYIEMNNEYGTDVTFVERGNPEGLGHAIYHAALLPSYLLF